MVIQTYVFSRHFLSAWGLCHSLNGAFHGAELFNYNEVHFIDFFSFMDCALVLYLRSNFLIPIMKISPYVSFFWIGGGRGRES